ncbi:MAG: hypothetical protein HW390_3234 [Candidatus Brocadiaceae bacterium]|nr:hypothetical protein [Candidatus Brocadiaceae bacterium]
MLPKTKVSKHPLFSLENLYQAYRKCRRHKWNTHNAMLFEQNLEENLVSLHDGLDSGSYLPSRSLCFLVEKPKLREIFAADFRYRVVHHVLVGYLEPQWERRFIHDSYACRRGKGTHKGVERLRSFTRMATANGSKMAWYLQLDVKGFFINFDRNILCQRLKTHEKDPTILWLIQVILFTEVTENYRFRKASRQDFECLPEHKTLFKASTGCGLPIGNLTSQFFANVYLDALDQFAKHQLKARFYLRYCDDLVLLSENREELAEWERENEAFLSTHLGLRLNEHRKLRPVSDGIDFLGYIVRPDYLLVRGRVVDALRWRLRQTEDDLIQLGMKNFPAGRMVYPWPWILLERTRQCLNSYLAHLEKASCYRLIWKIRERFFWLEEYFQWQKEKVVYRCPIPSRSMRFVNQKSWFKRHLPGHIPLIR